ncbi:MAG: hypothetical protein SPG97_02420 [Bacilli bacterium]|nr:hypothetical protein [Bacilli bacterium]
MSEHKIPIPSRIYNAAIDGHVAGADQIIDDKTGITLDKFAGGALEEKEYISGSNNGMGRVVLRKHLVEGVNTLTQSTINKSNTIYIIQYDFTLGEDITIPSNCVLEFDGGSISGAYTITGTNTGINAGLVKIFNTDVILSGTWNVAEAYPEWFGAKGDGITDDVSAINCALLYFNCVILSAKSYTIGSVDTDGIGIRIPAYRTLRGIYHDENLSKGTSVVTIKQGITYTSVVSITGKNCTLEDFSVIGCGVDGVETACVSTNSGYSRCTINRIDVSGTYYGFNLQLYLTTMTQCNANYCSIGFYIHGGDSTNHTTFTAICCYACDCRLRGHYWNHMTYSSLINCACDSSGVPTSGTIDNNTDIGYAYYFNACNSISVISCGHERCLRSIYCNLTQGISFKNCNFLMSKHQATTFDENFVLKDIVNIRYSVSVEIDKCYFNMDTVTSVFTNTTRLILLHGQETNDKLLIYNILPTGYIQLSNIGSEGFVTIWKNLKYIDDRYVTNTTQDNRPTFNSTIDKAYYSGFMFFDETLTPKKPIYWNGTAWVDATGTPV